MRSKAGQAFVWVGLLTVLLAGVAEAEPLRLTLEDALARAGAGNATVLASGKDVDTARANLERSEAWVPQNPFFSAGLLQTPLTGFGPNYGFSVSQELEIAGQRWKRIEAADAGLQKAEWDQRDQLLDLEASVRKAFAKVLLEDERVTVAERGADAVADLSRRGERADGESRAGATIDHNQIVIQAARSRRELATAEQERDDARDSLRYLLGLPMGQEIELKGAVDRSVKPLPSETELVAKALANRPDLTALQYEADRADKQIPVVRREGIPNVTLTANYSRFEGDDFAGGDVGFYLPVLRGTGPEMLEALADRDRAKLQLEDLKRSIARDVRQARRVCVNAGEDLELSQKTIVPLSRENLELQRRRFDRGEVGSAEVIGMLIDAQYAEKEYLDSVEAYSDAWIELEHTIAAEP